MSSSPAPPEAADLVRAFRSNEPLMIEYPCCCGHEQVAEVPSVLPAPRRAVFGRTRQETGGRAGRTAGTRRPRELVEAAPGRIRRHRRNGPLRAPRRALASSHRARPRGSCPAQRCSLRMLGAPARVPHGLGPALVRRHPSNPDAGRPFATAPFRGPRARTPGRGWPAIEAALIAEV